ncbi:uncharacterized protein LOC128987377 [Macrosteles quadrilineatus]|uniref:uncharacterized protein LOC128987377 n=1 Tax=Macrosteles quadrilineatus TaxID=74068 RepID=UPI0023E23D72|nr:uncharacterized protein LOC128987377 [Macrosteles quadrilineatus]
MLRFTQCLLVLVMAIVCVTTTMTQVICTSDADCNQDHCCVLEYGVRYGVTTCKALGGYDTTCRPDTLLNTTVKAGPSSPEVYVTGVHLQLCPCGYGLQCHSGSCQFQESANPVQVPQHPRLPQRSESHPAQVPQHPRLPQGSKSHPAQVPQHPRLPQGSESHPAQVPQHPRLPQGSESHPAQVPQHPRLPQGSESHPAQVPQHPRLPQGSESHPAQVPRLPQGSESHPAQLPKRDGAQ